MPNYGPRFRNPIFNSRSDLRLTAKEGNPYYSVYFETKSLIRLVEQETMKLRAPAFYQALRRANERAAVVVQEGQAESIRSQIGTHSNYGGRRPQREGNRLESSVTDEKNRLVYDNYFAVGIEGWLNKSPAALYWRVIEEGMAGYEANVLFTDNPGAGGRFFRPNVGGPHMRMPMHRGPRVHVSPIKAFNYSAGGRRAFARFDMGTAYIEELKIAGFTNVTKDPKGGIFKPQP